MYSPNKPRPTAAERRQALNITICRLMMHPAAIQSIQEAYL